MQETLLEATLLAEKFSGIDDWRGISSNVDDAEVTPENMVLLRRTLIDFTEEHRTHPDVGTALWALSKFYDKSLCPFFIAEMRTHCLARRFHPVWQADCALNILLGESVGYEYGAGKSDRAAYFDAVEVFLRKHGVSATASMQLSDG